MLPSFPAWIGSFSIPSWSPLTCSGYKAVVLISWMGQHVQAWAPIYFSNLYEFASQSQRAIGSKWNRGLFGYWRLVHMHWAFHRF
jgi:hypothetical protein